ncbi:glycosyl transferase family 2 [Nocardiopsis sinuspersici]|uniref:Glycosyl transferase family 2 n=1 Tax=Nocardiopsis sinuspersici TaxID=501010 RepID=A0A1V3BWN4_9ACTN|nr:glycosyl transferase family 2 [Nocardiopsis sinuspersici]
MSTSDHASGSGLVPGQRRGRTDPVTEIRSTGPHGSDGRPMPLLWRNDYSVLQPPPLGEWTPTLSVSVVIPAHGHPDKLAMVLASLSAQSYPAHLTEVVVVDDGSPEPLTLPPVRPENTRLITSASGGWGSGHAVNTGVADSSGEVVLRLDADMLVYREHVESQMRWHHLVDYAVVMGHKMFVDFDPETMNPGYVAEQVRAGRAADLFDRESAEPHWVERTIDRQDRLRTAHHKAYKVFVGATGSLHRTLFDGAGGMDTELILGGDSEFGYRASQQGAVFVPDLDTSSWHLGRTQMQTRHEAGTRYRMPFVANRVPYFHLRTRRPGRLWEVPALEAVMDVDGVALEDVEATASALLSGITPDIRLWLVGSWDALEEGRRPLLEEEHLDLRLVRELFRGDPRVRFTGSGPEHDPRTPFLLRVPAGARLAPGALDELLRAAERTGAGLLRSLPPGDARGGGVLRMERTAAYARARHLSPDAGEEERDRLVEQVCGIHWAGGEGIFAVPSAAAEETGAAGGEAALLRRRLSRAENEARSLRRRAERAERKLRWFTPDLVRRVLRRIVR